MKIVKAVAVSILLSVAVFLLADFIYHIGTTKKLAAWENQIVRTSDGIRTGFEPRTIGAGDTAVLFIPGFADGPPIWNQMSEAFAQKGYTCRLMRLPGFGGELSANQQISIDDWSATIEAEIAELRKSHTNVVIAAHSLGGTLAIKHIVDHRGSVDALVLLAPLFDVSNERSPLLPARKWFDIASSLLVTTKYVENTKPIDCKSDQAKRFSNRERFFPISIYKNMFAATDYIRESANAIDVPVYIALARDDQVIDNIPVERFYTKCQSGSKKLSMFEESGHGLPIDSNWQEIVREAHEFLQSQVGPVAPFK